MGGWRGRSFFDLYGHNMVRITTCVPLVSLADPSANTREIERLYAEACGRGAAAVIFPELCICGYSLDDLLQQDTILRASLEALAALKVATLKSEALLIVGAPLRFEGRLYNCAVVLSAGRTRGVVAKSYLPNFREFYEARQFVPARCALHETVAVLGDADVPFGANLVFTCEENEDFAVGVEICQDVWVPVPPSTMQAWRGATVCANLSASNITIGKAEYRHALVAATSARLLCAYIYASAGQGESTNDVAWDGQAIASECGDLLGDTARFLQVSHHLDADVDLDRIVQDRQRDGTWAANAADFRDRCARVRRVPFPFRPATGGVFKLKHRDVERRPYVPADPATLTARCYECYNIQVAGLVQRIRSCGLDRVVIGVSGGLDSTHALLVCCQAMDLLGLPRTNVLAYTMPGFATGEETKGYALDLMRSLRVSAATIDIRPSCAQMLADLQHPYSRGDKVYDVTFENVQAGERTSHLFRLANAQRAFVVGTGDLSELAMGWCTYGVGDHMSHYGLNASVPKSLIQCVIQWLINQEDDDEHNFQDAKPILAKILACGISPELVPQDDDDDDSDSDAKEEEEEDEEDGGRTMTTTWKKKEKEKKKKKKKALQSTEAAIGPYDLHDFQLYHVTRLGFAPAKCAYLAAFAWAPDLFDGRDGPDQPPNQILKNRDFTLAQILQFQRARRKINQR